jgi:Peptidase family M3
MMFCQLPTQIMAWCTIKRRLWCHALQRQAKWPLSPQQRCITTSYFYQLFAFGSSHGQAEGQQDSTVNPFLQALQARQKSRPARAQQHSHQPPTCETETSLSDPAAAKTAAETPVQLQLLPLFGHAKPHHVAAAVEWMQQEQHKHLTLLEETLSNAGSHESPAAAVPLGHVNLELVIRHLDSLEQPAETLRQMAAILLLLQDESEWRKSAALVSRSSISLPESTRQAVLQALHPLLVDSSAVSVPPVVSLQADRPVQHRSMAVAAQSWRRQQALLLKGTHFALRRDQTVPSPDEHDRDRELAEALNQVEQELLTVSPQRVSMATPPLIASVYQYIGLRNEQAIQNGYQHVTHQVFAQSNSGTMLAEVQELHAAVADKLVPYLIETMGTTPSPEETMLHSHYLSATGTTTTNASSSSSSSSSSQRSSTTFAARQQRHHDARTMLRLEEHVTLEGALQCAFRILQDVMGLSIVPAQLDRNAVVNSTWHAQVRLYHAYDDMNHGAYLGSFYLDPLAREEKLARNVTIPIWPRAHNDVTVSLALTEPAWDTDPIMVSWNQCEALFHEMGHVAQFLLAKSFPAGCLLGPQNVPLDFSEFLPKVRLLLPLSDGHIPLSLTVAHVFLSLRLGYSLCLAKTKSSWSIGSPSDRRCTP